MIHWVTTRVGQHTLGQALAIVPGFDTTWVRPWVVDDLARHVGSAEPPRGVWIFSDLERYGATQLAFARLLARSMRRRPLRYRVLNDPGRTLRRLPFLRRMHEAGVNDFEAWSLAEVPATARFPLIVRRANQHSPHSMELCQTWADFRARRRELHARPLSEEWTGIEWRAWQREDGLYRKFGAFVVGDAVVARHLFVGEHWMVKHQAAGIAEAHRDAEAQYLRTNPHARTLRHVARLAGLDYGRIDYDERPDGGLRIWEINTNPVIRAYSIDADPHRASVNDIGAARVLEHVRRVKAPRGSEPGPPLPPQYAEWVQALAHTRPGSPPSPERRRYVRMRREMAAALARSSAAP